MGSKSYRKSQILQLCVSWLHLRVSDLVSNCTGALSSVNVSCSPCCLGQKCGVLKFPAQPDLLSLVLQPKRSQLLAIAFSKEYAHLHSNMLMLMHKAAGNGNKL